MDGDEPGQAIGDGGELSRRLAPHHISSRSQFARILLRRQASRKRQDSDGYRFDNGPWRAKSHRLQHYIRLRSYLSVPVISHRVFYGDLRTPALWPDRAF